MDIYSAIFMWIIATIAIYNFQRITGCENDIKYLKSIVSQLEKEKMENRETNQF
jgi:hypothetical protein